MAASMKSKTCRICNCILDKKSREGSLAEVMKNTSKSAKREMRLSKSDTWLAKMGDHMRLFIIRSKQWITENKNKSPRFISLHNIQCQLTCSLHNKVIIWLKWSFKKWSVSSNITKIMYEKHFIKTSISWAIFKTAFFLCNYQHPLKSLCK